MPEEFSELQTLLRLKRYENPPPGYLDDFLGEFHRRQRAELLRRPLWRIALDRLDNLLPSFPALPVPNLAYAGVSALALVAAVGLISRNPVTGPVSASAGNSVAVTQPIAAFTSVAPLAAVRIAPDPDEFPFANHGTPAFVAPSARGVTTVSSDRPRYLLDTRPVRYEPRSTSF